MRFYTKKIGRNIKKHIFIALKSTAWRFTIVSKIIDNKTSESIRYPLYKTFNQYQALKKTLASFFVIIVVLAITSTAESSVELLRKLDTVNALPGNVESAMWHSPTNALSQDVNENGVYQSFTSTNATYFDGKIPLSDEHENGSVTIPQIDTQETVPLEIINSNNSEQNIPNVQGETSSTEVLGNNELNSQPTIENDTTTQIQDPVVDVAVPLPANNPPPENAPTPVIDTIQSSEASPSLEAMSRSFFKFSNIATALLPLAQEVLSTPILPDGVPVVNETEVILSSQEPEHVQEALIPEAIPVVENNVSPAVDTDSVSENEVSNSSSQEDSVSASKDNVVDGQGIITFNDFALPPLNSGQFIKNVQLRMSLAGLVHIAEGDPIPSIEVEYTLGDTWVDAGTILLDGEVSNALNGGYYLFALPRIMHVDELDHFSARVTYHGATEVINRVYIDSVWLQIDTETFDRGVLKERLLPQELTHLTLPTMYEFLSTDLDFTRHELPKFSLKYESQRNKAITFLRSLFGRDLVEIQDVFLAHTSGERIQVHPQIDVTADGLISIQLTEEDTAKLEPGAYTVEITVDEGGKKFTDSFEFQWGVLAINPDQTEYEVGETANVMLGAVSESGNTLCNADLRLYVIAPDEYISEVPVNPSGLCNGNNFIDVSDYTATVSSTLPGTYEMYVERLGPDGEVLAHARDTFNVVDSQPFTLEREGPTRINPKYVYPMTFTLTAQSNFTGELIEYVPADFTIVETNARVNEVEGMHELHFDVSLTAGETTTFGYTFDAPDISPFLYTLGPAVLVDNNDLVVIREKIQGETQSLVNEVLTTDPTGSVSITESDATISSANVDTPTQESVEEVSVNNASIDTQITDTSNTTAVTTTPEEVTSVESNDSVLPVTESVSNEATQTTEANTTTQAIDEVADENIQTTFLQDVTEQSLVAPDPIIDPVVDKVVAQQKNTFAEHRRWQIASDATGSMIVFWTNGASIPGGWTCISCTATSTFYQRFPLGGATYGTQGGSATQTHTADGVVNGNTLANAENGGSGFVSIDSHSHTITPSIGSTTTLPAYRQLRVIQYNSAGDPGTIPAGAILIFDGTLPSGWAEYTPLSDRYPYGQNTILSAGSNTHTHTVTGTTAAAGGSDYRSRTGGTQVTAAATSHTHTISSTTPLLNHEPPFITVIFATSSSATNTPLNAIAMWSDTPPAGWLNRSSDATKPFYNKYIKGASTYGTTGGADSHTHNAMAITSSAAIGTDNARSGIYGSNSTHTHVVDVTNFSTASNTPPYVTVIFAKFYGYVPIYDQAAYRWYVNENAQTPTDIWPAGAEALNENQAIDSLFVPVKNGDVIRLRMALDVSNSTTTGESFKLQYGTTTSECTAVPLWTDVGALSSSTAWIGYDNASVADGATLSSSTLTGTNKFESYEEINPTVNLPNAIPYGQRGEWDYVLKQNNAEAGKNYCFRMVQSNGTALFSYTQYPMLVTNVAPNPPTLDKLFDNEKVASTSPWFEFSASDDEANELTYQIQIDDDHAFGSVNIDNDSVTQSSQFTNLNTPADKDPYNNGETIRFIPGSALTNGITYYWRVRAKDPDASNAWGSWSTIYSFTIDTSVTVSMWHQTMEEQFDTGTHEGTDALVTDLVQLISGSTTGTTTSTQIDFTKGAIGNAWGTLSWTDNESVGDIKYHVQYYDETSSSWLIVPDTDLAGNTVGFDTSGVSLLSMDVETYRLIRLYAIFTNAGGTPTLSDWTVAWGYRIDTPSISSPFPSEKVGTTTPSFKFRTTDPQSDDLVYQIQWSTTYAFTASTTRTSSSSIGFVNLTNGGDLTPFNSGDTIQYTIQPADILANGVTYWWRVRAIDPNGSNQYSFFTDKQSFTVDTSITVSTWFQTTADQFTADTLSGITMISTTSATVATTSSESLIAYAEEVASTPKYRIWNGTTWSSQSNALDVGAPITWVVTKSAPSKNRYILATMGTDADVNVQVYKNGAWGDLQEVTTSITNTNMRGFDVAYEQLSGNALAVTCDGDPDPTYYKWDGTTWTLGGTGIGLTGGNTCGWVKLISDPVSNEIIAITRDLSGVTYEARVWNGSSWGNSVTWGSMQASQDIHEGIAAAYEESGDQAVVAVSNGTASSFTWRAWNGSAWSTAGTVTLGDDFEAGSIAVDKGTDNLALCYVDQDGDIGAVRWTGAAWTGQIELETAWTTASNVFNDRPVDCAFEVSGARDGYIMVDYSDTTNLRYRYWNGATWVAEASISTIQDSPRVQLRRTNDNLLQSISYDNNNDRYDYSYWNGTSWSAFQTLETNAAAGATPYKEPMMISPKNPSVEGAVVGYPQIDFYAGSGPYWQQMSWNDTESGGSSILYQVEYYNGSAWNLIPDSLIPGNSAGTTTSPINLTNVLPVSSYSIIRPVANLTCNLGTCPVLADWTITWSAGITISGTAKQFDQSTNVTSGTVKVAVNGVLQTGKTGTISGGTWSIANVNTSPGDIVTVFVDGASDPNEAVSIARYDGVGNMTGLKLFEQHLTLGSDDATTTPFTNANIGLYDYTQDEDLFFDATGTSLTMCADATCGDSELYIMATSTYAPGGTTNLNSIENNGTFSMGANTIYVARSWDNNATTTSGTSNVIFTATSTAETLDETGALSPTFYNLTFGTTTGAASWTLTTPLTIINNLTVTRGTLGRGAQAITLSGTLSNASNGFWTGMGTTTFTGVGTSNWSDVNATLQNVGRVVVDGTSKTIQLTGNVKAQSILIGADDILDASATNFNITVMSDWNNTNTFVPRSGTVFMSATTTNRTITTGSSAFYNLTFNGAGGAWSFTNPALTVNNNFTVSTGTVTMPTGTTTLGGSWSSVGGTFAHNNSTLYLTASAAKTISASGTPFINNFYNMTFNGSGSWTFLDTSATTSNNFIQQQGAITFPSANLSVGGNFAQTGGTFAHNNGTVSFTSATAKTVDIGASSFNSLAFTGSGSWSFLDASVTALGSVWVTGGTLTLPSGTLSIGGSYGNFATTTHNSGTVLFNSLDAGETVNLGNSSLYNMTFSGVGGGWTITTHATATNNVTLATSTSFTLASGQTLSVGGTFTNGMNGASTTWTGSTISLEAGNYSINTKTSTGDVYGTLRVKAGTNIKMWNSSSTAYAIDSAGSLYSQDHGAVDGNLYIWGAYTRSSGTEYWSYDTDFDGTALGGSGRTATIRFASDASAVFTTATLQIRGLSTATTTIDRQSSGLYGLTISNSTLNAKYYDVRHLNTSGMRLLSGTIITSLANGHFTLDAYGGTLFDVSNTTIDANSALQIQSVKFDTSLGTSSTVTTGNGDNTFIFFDDFNDGSINTSKWTKDKELGSITETGGYLRAGGGITSGNYGHVSLGSGVGYSNFLDNSVVWRARNSTNGIGELAFRGNYGSNFGYKARFDQRAGQGQAFLEPPYTGWAFSNGTGTCTSDGAPPTADQWYDYEVTAYGTNYIMYRDGTSRRNCTDNSYTTAGEIALQNHYGSYSDYDWVGVRPFVTPEPTHTSWGTREEVTPGLYRKRHVITGSTASAQTNYVLPVVVNYATGTDSGGTMYCNGLCQTNFSDVRFANSDGSPANYWRDDTFATSSTATFWVQFASVPLSPATTSVFAYFGNVGTGYNVTQSGGTPTSYWWFRQSAGDINGEAFDNDTGDPGSIRWDDSSLVITVSGTVYSDDGITPMGSPTCDGSTPVVKVVVNGSASTTGSCASGNGTFSISGVTIIGDPVLTIYLDTNGGPKGTVVTKTPTGNITKLDIYQNRVITRHEDTSPLTILDMATYDSDNDSDIAFSAATGTLSVFANTELHVASSTTFTPGGNITINGNASSTVFDGSLHLDDNATLIGFSTSTITVGGSFTMDVGATFTSASTTVLMNATTTGKSITTPSPQEISFNTLSFSGVGGGWNMNGDIRALGGINVTQGTVTGTKNIDVVNGSFSGNGTLSLGSGTTTIEKTNTLGGVTPWTFANLVLGNAVNSGTTTPASNATTTILGKLTISTAHFLNAVGSTFNFAGTGNVFTENGTFVRATSTVRYSGTGATNILSTNYYNLDFKAQGGSPTYTATGLGIVVTNNLTVGGPSTTTVNFDTSDPALDVNGGVRIDSTGTLVGSASAVTTVAGDWDNKGTFTGSNGTVTFDTSGTTNIYAGASSFSNVVINGTGAFVVTEPATTTSTFTLTNAGSFSVSSGQSLAVGGTFSNTIGGGVTTWIGSILHLYGGGNYSINASTTGDTYGTLSVGSGTQIRMWNSDAGAYSIHSTGSLYSQDHATTDGSLYIFGAYTKTSGIDYWSYARDFDGTLLGAPRNANVYIANGSSILYTGGGLSVLGTPTGTTTIQNQGSGTYAFRIGGTASTTWSYYRVRNTDLSGLVFSGTPNVTTLSYGNFDVSQNNATAMTVGGSVINQNQARTFTTNYFGVTGASPAYNVTATGTTVSSWKFTNHGGALAGEAFDVDPGPGSGDPGYIVWDNSSTSLSISGNVYSGEGSGVSTACDGTTNNITLVVVGATSYSTSCAVGTGYYTITGVSFNIGDAFIVYINGEPEEAATVSEDAVSSVGNLDLYENRVIVRHEGADPLSIADMTYWDSSDDPDIPFTAVTGSPDTLTLPSDRKLIVWAGKTFRPGGNVTVSGGGAGASYDGTLELYASALFDATGSETHTIGGSLISGTGAAIDTETSSFVFTTTGVARTVDTNEYALYNALFNGSGSWTVTNTGLVISNDLTITQGALTLPTGTTTVAGSFLNTGGSFSQNGGQMYFTSSGAENVRTGTSNFGTTTFNGTGNWTYLGTNSTSTGNFTILQGTVIAPTGTLAVGGNFINNATFTHSNGTLRLLSGSTTASLKLNGSDLSNLTIAGTGSYTMTDLNAALMGTLSITNGNLTLASGTVSIAGSLLNTGGTFNNASGTILFNSTDTGELINVGSSSFNNVSFASASGGWTITNNATSTGNFSVVSAANFTVSSSTRVAVGGVFTNLVGGGATTWTGSTLVINSGTSYTINTKSAGGDVYNNILIGSSTALRAWGSAGTITTLDANSSLYSQNHAGVSGSLYIFGNYMRSTGADYWSYATDFDGTALGGSSRQALVYFASGASTTLTGGTLNIIGVSGFDTTISNQGSGVYGVNVYGGTLNALYYSFANLGSQGLILSGATTVITSLTEGNFILAINGGSLITLSSTTLNYNAGLTVTGSSFATTSAITGYNINLVGTTPSAWTFTGHTGNLSGEYFDNDGGTDCGSIRWDNSTCLLTQQSAYRWRHDDGGESVPDSEWYSASWSKRERVKVTNADAQSYTNATVKLTVTYDSDMQSDFDDLRFTSADGTTLLSHFTEKYTASSQATVWVKIPLLATSTATDIYMYYGNGGVSDASATTTFPFMDSFESGNLSRYSGETSQFAVGGSSAYERTYRLNASDPNNSQTISGGMYNNNVTVSQGQTLRFFQYIDTGTGSGDETCTLFGAQSQTLHYAVCLELYGVDRLSIAKDVVNRDTSGTVLSSTTVTYTTGWYEVEVKWNVGGLIDVTLSQNGSLVATTSVTDSTYTSGGVGFTVWSYHGGWDIYSSRTLITTTPTVTYGYEQVSGGASWKSALNTKATGVNIGDIMRPRFVIENTGLTVSDAYTIEYAPKGASPSCASVSSGSYNPVPVQASCGSSPFCMQSSTYITNNAGTTDVLGGQGTFVPGNIIENPSNITPSISINSNEYTEVEFAITPTNNVADSSYCFRVSDNGTPIDSYAKVAEMELVFIPTVTSLSLNGGGDIYLLPGGTTTIYATGTVSDSNGYTDLDINRATTTIYRSGVTDLCSVDNNNCYISAGPSKCSYSNCSGNSCDISCSADFYFHADPTDMGTYGGETWRATLSVSDMGGQIASGTAPSIDLISIQALTVNTSINYGALAVNTDTGSYTPTTTVQNIGNSAIDVSIEGSNLTDGGTSIIPVTEQIFATSTFTYSSCGVTVCSQASTTPIHLELDLGKPASTTPSITDDLFWGIAIPYGVSGSPHSGTNIFYAVPD